MKTPEIKQELILDILKGFKEKAPGPSGVTRSLLLKSHSNILKMYAEVFTPCLATGYFPAAFKTAKIVMVRDSDPRSS